MLPPKHLLMKERSLEFQTSLSSALSVTGKTLGVGSHPSHKETTTQNGILGTLWQTQRAFPPRHPALAPALALSLHVVKNQGSDSSMASKFFCLKDALKKKKSYMVKEYGFLVLNERALIDLYLSLMLHL